MTVSPLALKAAEVDAPIKARAFHEFKSDKPDNKFGALEFLGGIEYTSVNDLVGAVSGIRFRPDGKSFVAVLDTGHWMTGMIERDGQGRLSGMLDVRILPMVDASGREPRSKGDIDAEGVTLRDGEVIVSFERRHRVDVYPDPSFETSRPKKTLDFLIPRRELRANGGLETVVSAPQTSPLAGAIVVVAEKSVDDAGNFYAAILEGPRKGQFKVKRHHPFDITDGAFLPNGDLVLLERSFSVLGGVGMRIRRMDGDSLKPGALVDGEMLIEADMGQQIDNMEGIDVVAGPDGVPHLIVVSDDNHSIFQRNLMLEFRLNP
ncbi:esterase-like activity of phytase family protein [Endobacterium cereale]|nr:esterase-like activity of phytase family protein [Endobacterium cereale]MEB2847706.1 esterase-like activity of phytase family protein [Endobacterium cereale]